MRKIAHFVFTVHLTLLSPFLMSDCQHFCTTIWAQIDLLNKPKTCDRGPPIGGAGQITDRCPATTPCSYKSGCGRLVSQLATWFNLTIIQMWHQCAETLPKFLSKQMADIGWLVCSPFLFTNVFIFSGGSRSWRKNSSLPEKEIQLLGLWVNILTNCEKAPQYTSYTFVFFYSDNYIGLLVCVVVKSLILLYRSWLLFCYQHYL